MSLPQDILDRVNRVIEYHLAAKHCANPSAPSAKTDAASQPNVNRIFSQLPKVALPTTLLDASVQTILLLANGRDALPDSQVNPPQNLKTLATWLFMSNGLLPVRRNNKVVGWERTCPSGAGTAPCELYVAAFAIEGLEPGLYHYSPREFSLRKMRDGYEALSLLKRGRPDLEFLKTTPAAVLVSTVFARSAWKFESRGYRHALQDAGQMLENVSICGAALGLQTIARMRLTESTSHELIGVPADASFDEAESVQAMIVWTDPTPNPMPIPAQAAVVGKLAPIARPPAAHPAPEYVSILSVHGDCVAPGIAVREIRAPLTELSPMPANAVMIEKPAPDDPPPGDPLFQALTSHRPATDFVRRAIGRDPFLTINAAAFRGGSHFPLFPDGPHVALVRPFWIVHDVLGLESGIWYYHPPTDRWAMLARGNYRIDTSYLCCEQPLAAHASAVCFMAAHLGQLMLNAGPDLYRLAHLEAGIAAQRIYLGANSLSLGCALLGDFYDDQVRKFLGLAHSGWEVIHAVAIGVPGAYRQDDDDTEDLDASDLLEDV
jgi:SagB-type dehydrogenase family enzyme